MSTDPPTADDSWAPTVHDRADATTLQALVDDLFAQDADRHECTGRELADVGDERVPVRHGRWLAFRPHYDAVHVVGTAAPAGVAGAGEGGER